VTEEIALFIDFENIRYSLINVQHREPDPQELIAMARRFGTVMVARAYADWTRQPEFFKGSLTAAMIDRVDCPAKVRDRFRDNRFGPPFQQPGPYSYQPAGEGDEEGDDDEEFAQEEEQEDGEPRAEELQADDAGQTEQTDAADPGETDAEAEGDQLEDGEDSVLHGPVPAYDDRRPRYDGATFQGGYQGGYQGGNQNGGYYNGGQAVYTQSTVDLNMLMDIIETVFDRPSIGTYILMSGDRDFTRIAARLKLRLNKRVIVIGVPGTVSRDLISAAEQYIPLGYNGPLPMPGPSHHFGPPVGPFGPPMGPVEPEEPGFIQFLDYIDRHWSWRTVIGVSNFIGDPFNPKNRFRGRLTRDSARELLRACLDDGILIQTMDLNGGENLRLNRQHPAVESVLNEATMR
jgi:uncharacterized LabA/DUF88 family protein